MENMRLGYQASSVTPYLDTPENILSSFKKLSEIGYKFIQLQGVPKEIDDTVIVSALAESGLICVGTQEDYILGFGDDPDRYIKRALAVGAEYLAFALIPFELDTADAIRNFAADKLLPIVRKAEEAGLVFSFHPIGYDYRLIEGMPAYEILMESLPESVHLTFCVSACFDSAVRPEEVFEKYGDRMELVHFKDFVKDDEGKNILMPLGQGLHDWVSYLNSARKCSVKYIFAEQESWQKDAFECAKDSFDYLTGIGL